MKHSDFQIGATFWCGGHEWRCTDIGTRTIIAVQVDEVKVVRHSPGAPKSMVIGTSNREQAHAEGWFSGPPYMVSETVFDEYDMAACSFDCEGHGTNSVFRTGKSKRSSDHGSTPEGE